MLRLAIPGIDEGGYDFFRLGAPLRIGVFGFDLMRYYVPDRARGMALRDQLTVFAINRKTYPGYPTRVMLIEEWVSYGAHRFLWRHRCST